MKDRKRYLIFVVVVFVSFLLSVPGLLISPAGGAPGTGTSITVQNVVTGAAPSSAWSYTITELNPPKGAKPYTASFTLPAAGGGTYSFGGLRSGAYRAAEIPKFGYYATMTITSNKYSGSQIVTGFEVVINLASSEGKTVAFTNYAMPSFTLSGLVPPPGSLNYNIPPLKPIPIQASWNVDINNDGRLDLVLGKPTAILVNLTGPYFPSGSSVSVSVAFEGNVYNRVVSQSDLASSPIVSYYPIVPSSVGNETITGIYQVIGGNPNDLSATNVTVKNTTDLSLYYAYLTKPSSYGTESQSAFNDMAGNSVNFINATYPVKNVKTSLNYNSIAGSKPGTARDPYAGMLKDAMAVAQQAQLIMGGSAVGVAIGPAASAALPDYFSYQGFPGAAGVSFGPAVKGVIALDGYYTAPAHEVAHTFGLYYGVPEEYVVYSPYGTTTSGVWAAAGQWKTGYDFMGVAPYRTTDLSWVNTTTTYAYLFNKTVVIPGDPEILLANGVIYENGTVGFPLDWVHLQTGTPDTLTSGNYLLNFTDGSGKSYGTVSFDVSFSVQIDGDYHQTIQTDQAGFSFATAYPPVGTTQVQIVNNTDPRKPVVMGIYYMANVKTLSSSASLTGTEGLNGWYVSDVDVTITATADPFVGLQGINYTLDDVVQPFVYGNTATFTMSTDGTHSFTYWGVDSQGREGVHHTQAVNIDKTAPTITINSPVATSYTLGQKVAADWSAADSVSGLDYAIGTVASGQIIDTSTPGAKTFTVTAYDKAGNTATQTVTYSVGPYVFGGFLSPIPNSVYNQGRTVPVKFQLTDYQGNFVTWATAKIYVTQMVGGVWGTPVLSGVCRYDSTTNQYAFNLDTKSLSSGALRITAVLDDGTPPYVDIWLR